MMRQIRRPEKSSSRRPHAVFNAAGLQAGRAAAMVAAMRSLFLIAAALVTLPAAAASSNWVAGEGARLRLVTAGPADGPTRDGVLEIELAPGWKTYWIDPGDAGVPPSLTLARTGAAVPLRLPAPEVIDEAGAPLVGYDRPVRFLATLPAGPIEADVFIGVCKKICVPVSGRLSLDPDHGGDAPRDAAIVEEARFALPQVPRDGFAARAAALDGSTLLVAATVPTPGNATLYLAGRDGWRFLLPRRLPDQNGQPAFAVDVLRDAAAPWPEGGFTYVLVSDGLAVEGQLAGP